MSACASCGHENQPWAKFCSECGVALVETEARGYEERKIVTVLFADLVGFTSRAEQMDPEDVRALLSPYYARLRLELERFGGTVEKFIGDAVMALFGAPVAHEDDPERAVRAALAIRDWAREDEQVQVRIAVNTGEALINLGARPDAGEGMAAGDVVNTAARLQSASPVNGVLVGEMTYRATRTMIDYSDAEPVAAKGKADAVRVWEAVAARARVTAEAVSLSTPLLGRERELAVLRELLVRVREESSPQLVTLVGVPGIGKSRLVLELMQIVEQGGVLTYWRRGRSLPYGEGVTLWALSEIVKAQAGILETDSDDEVARKLHTAVENVLPEPADAAWVEEHLCPLAGITVGEGGRGDRRKEAFAAWRHFFEGLAGQRPLVLVFEDLHWADDELLEFVDWLVDWATEVPILIVCTARPELLERRAGWGGGKLNSTTLSLAPLSEADTSRLLSSLLDRPLLEAQTHRELLMRAGGNPLYAEQYAQMLLEGADSRELPVPESVQGIIAARLDRLPHEEKGLLQDAAVLGKVFWLGGLIDGRLRREAEEALHALQRKGFVQRARTSSVAGEDEYSFLHLLMRDVAYGQIPRTDRGEKHQRAATWIESLGRSEDHAEMLTHHYLSALELARVSGADARSIAEPARRALRNAGDRAYGLHVFPSAARFYGQALELWPDNEPERPRLLLRLGESLHLAGLSSADEILDDASGALAACGDKEGAAEAEALLAEIWWLRGDARRFPVHIARAQALVEHEPPSPARARVLSVVSRYGMLAADYGSAIATGREALELAEALGLDAIAASSLITIGTARARGGDAGGVADIERGTQIAESIHSPEASRGYNNLSVVLEFLGDLERMRVAWKRSLEWADRVGSVPMARFARGTARWFAWIAGDWDEALRLADEFIAECEAGSPHAIEANVRGTRAFIRLARNDEQGALDDAQRASELRLGNDNDSAIVGLQWLLHVQVGTGRVREAQQTVEELLSCVEGLATATTVLLELAFAAARLDRLQAVRAVVERLQPRSVWTDVAVAILDGEFEEAADILRRMGARPYEALAHLRAAQRLVADGRRADADTQLQKALGFWRSVDATRYVCEGEALLAASA